MRKTRGGKKQQKPLIADAPKYLERTRNRSGEVYLYYKRAGRRIPLPKPEGSEAFRIAYDKAAARFAPKTSTHTIGQAITAYMASADFSQLSRASQRDYRYYLNAFSRETGEVSMTAIDAQWLKAWRETYVDQPNYWNALRARMTAVTVNFMDDNPKVLAANPWPAARRLKVEQSDQNKPWPMDVLRAAFNGATPQFRGLLVVYLLTAQRGGDVIQLGDGQFDEQAGTLTFEQGKTGEAMMLPVPPPLAAVLARPLRTPRGVPWTVHNAQDHLRCLLRRLKLPRYTLHGLRSTGPTALKHMGFENRVLRAMTGHTSDRNLEVYLRGVAKAPLAKVAMEAMAEVFADLLSEKPAPKKPAFRRRVAKLDKSPIQPSSNKVLEPI